MTTALSGIRVLDLSRILAGPWATQTLADLGADVIKVERPGRGDDTRTWGPPYQPSENSNAANESAYFLAANRGKKSIALDITSTEGQLIIRELIESTDILVENFKVGGLKKYGLDYERLRKITHVLFTVALPVLDKQDLTATDRDMTSCFRAWVDL